MNLIRADKNQIKHIKRLYKFSFPRGERKPFWLIRKKQREGLAEILAICDDGFLGLAICKNSSVSLCNIHAKAHLYILSRGEYPAQRKKFGKSMTVPAGRGILAMSSAVHNCFL